MKILAEQEIASLVRPRNHQTGVNEISEEMLRSIDLDALHELVPSPTYPHEFIADGALYTREYFIPRAGSIYSKPSFAGRQVLIGKIGRNPIFSNGVWFSGGYTKPEIVAEVSALLANQGGADHD